MEIEYFTFTLDTNTEAVQYRVKVYTPQPTSPISGLTPRLRGPKKVFDELLSKLQVCHIDIEPDPIATLVHSQSRLDLPKKIETLPANAEYRNIHFQAGKQSYAVVSVESGGELCFNHYKIKLFRFIKQGLDLSFQQRVTFSIRVTVEKKEQTKAKSPWQPMVLTRALLSSIVHELEQKLKYDRERVVSKRMASAKNVDKIVQKSDMIEHVVAAIEQRLEKTTKTEGTHAVTKKMTTVPTLMGFFSAARRLSEGDWTGTFLKMLSDAAGTEVSLALDGTLLAKDIKEASKAEKKQRHLTVLDIDCLLQENDEIREELAKILPESPIYGAGCTAYFDESELADLEDIVQIKVRSDDLIHAIQVIYRSQSGKQHGGDGGDLITFDLALDEKITMVSGTMIQNGSVLSSLSFYTDYDRQKTFGKVNGQEFQFEMTNGSYLGAIKGYDAYSGGRKIYPPDLQILPAVGFIAKL